MAELIINLNSRYCEANLTYAQLFGGLIRSVKLRQQMLIFHCQSGKAFHIYVVKKRSSLLISCHTVAITDAQTLSTKQELIGEAIGSKLSYINVLSFAMSEFSSLILGNQMNCENNFPKLIIYNKRLSFKLQVFNSISSKHLLVKIFFRLKCMMRPSIEPMIIPSIDPQIYC